MLQMKRPCCRAGWPQSTPSQLLLRTATRRHSGFQRTPGSWVRTLGLWPWAATALVTAQTPCGHSIPGVTLYPAIRL